MKIEIIPNPVKDRGHICTERLLSLLSDCGCEVYMPQTAEIRSTAMISGEYCTGVPDMIIVLGGDGLDYAGFAPRRRSRSADTRDKPGKGRLSCRDRTGGDRAFEVGF